MNHKWITVLTLVCILFAGKVMALDLKGVDVHGFASQGYVDTTGNNFFRDTRDGSFEYNETGINFSGQLNEKLRLGVQFLARDFGDVGNNDVQVDWAYADYRYKDWLGLRFGLLKAPHGLYNETRDIDMVRNSIFLPQSVYPETLRDVNLNLQGAGIYGSINLNRLGGLSYQAMYGTQEIEQNDRAAEVLAGVYTTIVSNDDFDVDYKYAASLAWDTPFPGLRLGCTVDATRMTINEYFNQDYLIFTEGTAIAVNYDKLLNWVYSVEYTWNNLTLVGEYLETEREYAFSIDLLPEQDLKPYGWYLGAAYRFTTWFELGAYYSKSKNDPADLPAVLVPDLPGWQRELQDICVTLRFDINPYWAFKLEAHDFEGSYGLSPWDNPATDIGENYKKDWEMYAVKTTVAF